MRLIKAIIKNSLVQITAMALTTALLFVFITFQMFNAILVVDPVLEKKLEHFESRGGWKAQKERIKSWEAEDAEKLHD